MSLTIALDYDGTYTADRELWRAFIADVQARGHVVIMVTNRGPDSAGPITEDVGLAIVYCNNRPKRRVALEQGHTVHIWIDDLPHLVDFGNVPI